MIYIAIIEDIKDVALELQRQINLENDMKCPYIYFNAEDAMTFLSGHPVDILLVDIGLPKANGIEVINYFSQLNLQMQYCVFTIHEDDEKIFSAIHAGASGYILKNSPSHKIISSIRELYEGGSPMSPGIARKVLQKMQLVNPIKFEYQTLALSNREHDILVELSKGLLYKEIANNMKLTIGTIKQHIHKIYDKLKVNNRTEAINKLININPEQ